MPTSAEKIEKKAKGPALSYEDFLRSLQLNVISLKEASCRIDRIAYWKHKGRQLSYKMTAEVGEIDDGFFDVQAKLDVTMSSSKPEEQIIRISATFDLHFHAEAIPKSLVDKFCKSEVRLIVWPYFREYVSDVSSRMYIPPVILPLSNEPEA